MQHFITIEEFLATYNAFGKCNHVKATISFFFKKASTTHDWKVLQESVEYLREMNSIVKILDVDKRLLEDAAKYLRASKPGPEALALADAIKLHLEGVL